MTPIPDLIDRTAQLAGLVVPLQPYMPVGRAFVEACLAERDREWRDAIAGRNGQAVTQSVGSGVDREK